jgi:hypothetical protein
MLTYLYLFFKSFRNEIIGIIITVIPGVLLTAIIAEHTAGNINNKLFPFPVSITVNIGLFPVIIALIAFF